MPTTWKERLKTQMPPDWSEEIDVFENQMILRKQDKLDEKVFAETRLRRGAYGQRYDNGQRHDGIRTRELSFPTSTTKGAETEWDAPGMQRIKFPFGGMNPEQLELLADLAEEYADGIIHVTTRQAIQYHFVHIEDVPDLMRRLASLDITTREACGNSVRNVTACPLAGVCRGESFDTTAYANAMFEYFLGHDDVQDFGRKFKPAFSGCEHEACGLVKMHDIGYLAQTRLIDGQVKRGFRLYVGGGLGTIPQQAKVLAEFVSEEEFLPVTQAVCRVFARLGEKKNRNRARIKFLVEQLGIEEFTRLVVEERKTIPDDPRWLEYLNELDRFTETPSLNAKALAQKPDLEGFDSWFETNTYKQKQAGYYVVTVNLPLGDLSTEQAYKLADIARKYTPDSLRTTVEQNIVLRWVTEADLPNVYQELKEAALAKPGAGTIVDITSCPGTDTCKLGIAASRGLAGELSTRLAAKNGSLNKAIKDLRIKVSGCFNSCGGHHIADIGFFGNSRKRNNRTVPHFQVVLGGTRKDNAGSYGMAVGAIPSKNVPDFLDTITGRYAAERLENENFKDWVNRLGKLELKKVLDAYTEVPIYETAPQFYSDWGDVREFSVGDIGVGECAGEVVSLFSLSIAQAEGTAFEALIALDEKRLLEADEKAYKAMLQAARSLVLSKNLDVGEDPNTIVSEFDKHFVQTELFFDKYAKAKFAQYLSKRHEQGSQAASEDKTRTLIEEAHLFIEAAHACDARLGASPVGVSA